MKGKNKLVPRLLGITKESVMRVDEKTKDVVQDWPLTTVKRWAASPKSFTLVLCDSLHEDLSITHWCHMLYNLRTYSLILCAAWFTRLCIPFLSSLFPLALVFSKYKQHSKNCGDLRLQYWLFSASNFIRGNNRSQGKNGPNMDVLFNWMFFSSYRQ